MINASIFELQLRAHPALGLIWVLHPQRLVSSLLRAIICGAEAHSRPHVLSQWRVLLLPDACAQGAKAGASAFIYALELPQLNPCW